MKTKTYTMIVLLALSASVIFAGGIKHHTIKSVKNSIEVTIGLEKLAPSTPLFADFADGTEYKAGTEMLVSKLVPVTPKVAEFEDPGPQDQINIEQLAPVSPKETDFEDIDIPGSSTLNAIAPVPPIEADFTE